ncbi:MAG: hypothetical protein IKG08_08520 [Eubacterium sp.]|nr:hypothetical protein [Eubacterium sp.]
METYYLIDYENVHEDGLKGIQELTEEDHVCLMFTPNALKISLDILTNVRADFKVIKAPAGKQSLDMHIGTFLGFLVGSNSDRKCGYVIVSKDTDFDAIIRFWNASGLGEFSRQPAIRFTELAVVQNQPAVPTTSSRSKRTSSRRKNTSRTKTAEQQVKPEAAAEEAAVPVMETEAAPAPEAVPEEAVRAEEVKPEAAVPEVTAVEPETEVMPEAPEAEETAAEETAAAAEEAKTEEKEPEAKPEKTRSRRGRPRRNASKKTAEEPAEAAAEVQEAKEEKPFEKAEEKQPEKPAAKPEEKASSKAEEKQAEKPAEAAPAAEEHGKADLKTQVNNRVVRVLRDNQVDTAAAQAVASIVVSNMDKKNVKQLAYRGIVNKFGQKTGLLYYNLIRKEI